VVFAGGAGSIAATASPLQAPDDGANGSNVRGAVFARTHRGRNRYIMTDPTMIQASVATMTLATKASGKKRPHLSLRQGANVGPLPCWLFAASDVGSALTSVSRWGDSEIIRSHLPPESRL